MLPAFGLGTLLLMGQEDPSIAQVCGAGVVVDVVAITICGVVVRKGVVLGRVQHLF